MALSPPSTMLHRILITAIATIITMPILMLRFQNARQRQVKETGTARKPINFSGVMAEVRYCISMVKKSETVSLTWTGAGNQNMLVRQANMVMLRPNKLRL